RMPVGGYASVQQQVNENPGRFGYDEVTHKFNLPPTTGRPELIFYASRSTSDTGVQFNNFTNIVNTPLLRVDSVDTGDNITLNQDLGARFSTPAPSWTKITGILFAGLDFKQFKQQSFNTNNFLFAITETNSSGSFTIHTNLSTGQPPQTTAIDYLPLNFGLSGAIDDIWGTTFYNAQFNIGVPIYSRQFSIISSTNKIS